MESTDDTILDMIDAIVACREKGEDDLEILLRFSQGVVSRDQECERVCAYLKRNYGAIGVDIGRSLKSGAHRR